jgi:toxin-antitoxin system PIN domain toxin
MVLPDVNVLIYALRPDMAQHEHCRRWLTRVVENDAAFAMSHLVLSAVIRISTTAKAFREPCSLDEAFGFSENLLSQPHCRLVEPGEDHWRIFERLCRETDTCGPRVTDAWLAALAIEHGCEWVTLDRDFARFPGLKWSVPT